MSEITWLDLGMSGLLVLVVVAISAWQGLGIERRLLLGSLRCIVQLIAIGFILGFFLRNDAFWLTLLAVLFQITMAIFSISNLLDNKVRHRHLISLIALLPSYLLVILTLMLLVIKPEPLWNPRYVLPLGGMLLGNSVAAIALVMDQYVSRLGRNRDEIFARLALGVTWRTATAQERQQTLASAITPTVSALYTVGIVALPGMMTGQIIAGANVMQAVNYQIVVMFMLTAVVSLATTITILLLGMRRKIPHAG